MKLKNLALGLLLLFFGSISTSAIATVVNLDNGITIAQDDKTKDKKKSKAKTADMKSCKDKKACCATKAGAPECKDKKAETVTTETPASPEKK